MGYGSGGGGGGLRAPASDRRRDQSHRAERRSGGRAAGAAGADRRARPGGVAACGLGDRRVDGRARAAEPPSAVRGGAGAAGAVLGGAAGRAARPVWRGRTGGGRLAAPADRHAARLRGPLRPGRAAGDPGARGGAPGARGCADQCAGGACAVPVLVQPAGAPGRLAAAHRPGARLRCRRAEPDASRAPAICRGVAEDPARAPGPAARLPLAVAFGPPFEGADRHAEISPAPRRPPAAGRWASRPWSL